jgi:hypothetical protein
MGLIVSKVVDLVLMLGKYDGITEFNPSFLYFADK